MGYNDTIYYCPQCELKVSLDRSLFKGWTKSCPGCKLIRMHKFIPQEVHYERIYEYVKKQKVEEAKIEVAVRKKLGIA